MKLITKRHKAKVVQSEDGSLSLELLDTGEVIENIDPQQMRDHYRVEVVAKNVGIDNSKYRKIALAGKKAGEEVQVVQKYLVD